jgi:hypothetical protein
VFIYHYFSRHLLFNLCRGYASHYIMHFFVHHTAGCDLNNFSPGNIRGNPPWLHDPRITVLITEFGTPFSASLLEIMNRAIYGNIAYPPLLPTSNESNEHCKRERKKPTKSHLTHLDHWAFPWRNLETCCSRHVLCTWHQALLHVAGLEGQNRGRGRLWRWFLHMGVS